MEPREPGLDERAREKGGETIGPSPTDRGRGSTKLHLIVDRLGTPLACLLSPGNRHDSLFLASLLDAVSPVQGPKGRPRRRPGKLHADKAYDHAVCREACRDKGVRDRIARRKIDSSERVGRHRWVVERSFAWLRSMRRLGVRWERKAAHWLAFALLGCALLCLRRLVRHLGL